MPFSPTPIPHSGFGGGMGSARRSGAGLATWKVIQDMLEGPRTHEAKTPLVGAVGQVLPEELNASTEPSKYLVPDLESKFAGDENPALHGPVINRQQYDEAGQPSVAVGRKWEEGLAPSENYEAQADAMAKPRAPSYAGRALRPQDYEPITELQRAEAEYKEALDHSTTFAGQLTRGWSQDRINKAAAKVEMAKAKVESITPQDVKLGDELLRVDPSGRSKIIAAGTQKYRPGEVAYRSDTGASAMPAGQKLPKDPTPRIEFVTNEKGERVAEKYDPVTDTITVVPTGVSVRQPREPEGPGISWGRPEPKLDAKGAPVLDADGNPVMVEYAYTHQGDRTSKYRPAAPSRAGVGRTGGGKTPEALAKNYKPAVVIEADDPYAHAKTLKNGDIFHSMDGKRWWKVLVNSNGDHIPQPIPPME